MHSRYSIILQKHFNKWKSIPRVKLGNMFENGCYLRRQKRFKIPKTEKGEGGHKRVKEGSLRSRHGHGHSNGELGGEHDVKKPSLKSSDLFSGEQRLDLVLTRYCVSVAENHTHITLSLNFPPLTVSYRYRTFKLPPHIHGLSVSTALI